MLGNKSLSASAHEVIIQACNVSKNYKRSLNSIDILIGIMAETTNFAGRSLKQFGVSQPSVNGMYTPIAGRGRAENFTLAKFCQHAESIAKDSEDNMIMAEHMLMAIIADRDYYANTALTSHNLNLLDIESSIVDHMGRPGFLYSYLEKQEFWNANFTLWTKSNPALYVQPWIRKVESETAKNAAFAAVSGNKECGLIIKESKITEFVLNTVQEPAGKFLVVTGTRRYCQVIQTCFISFALGRLAFKEDKA